MAFINFEKRQNNPEKVKELYFRAYTAAVERQDVETVTYVVVQYARFLAYKCDDCNRAVEIMNQAIEKCKGGAFKSRGTKTLFLSYVNLLKHLEGNVNDVYGKIVQVFEKAMNPDLSLLSQEDRSEIARFYLEYLQEYAPQVAHLRATERLLKDRGYINNAQQNGQKRVNGGVIKQSEEFSVAQTGGQIQRDQEGIALGKRS
jgi:hypothetical protein